MIKTYQYTQIEVLKPEQTDIQRHTDRQRELLSESDTYPHTRMIKMVLKGNLFSSTQA